MLLEPVGANHTRVLVDVVVIAARGNAVDALGRINEMLSRRT